VRLPRPGRHLTQTPLEFILGLFFRGFKWKSLSSLFLLISGAPFFLLTLSMVEMSQFCFELGQQVSLDSPSFPYIFYLIV
jgi:hypothetical protein